MFCVSFLFIAAAVAVVEARVASPAAVHPQKTTMEADVVVYGSTPAGVMAAVAAARQGASTLLVDPNPRVGGVCSGGLGRTDKGNPIVIGGLAREFFLRNARHYNQSAARVDPGIVTGGYFLEPHVAEEIFLEMLHDAGVQHVRTGSTVAGARRRRAQVDTVVKAGTKIETLIMEDGATFSGRVFIDASYEGDVMARSGTSFTWGREPADAFNESLGGRREPFSRMDWAAVSPYQSDGTLLFPLVTDALAAPVGAGDKMVGGRAGGCLE